MPQTALEGALHKIEQLRQLVEAIDFSDQGLMRPVSFSAGVTDYQPRETTLETIKRADKALYAAKHEGRNRVLPAKQTELL